MRVFLLLFALAAAAVPGAAESLLDNGGFEEGDPPAGWRLPPQSPLAVDRAMVAEGRRSLTYNNLTPDKPGPWSVSHPIVAPPAGLLSIRGQLRPSAFRGSVRAAVYQANPYTGELQLMGESTLLSSPQSSTTSGWKPFRFLSAASPDGGRGALHLTFHGSGQVWVDDLEVTVASRAEGARPRPSINVITQVTVVQEVGIATGANILADSGFEGAGVPWCRLYNPRRAQGVVCRFDRREAYRGRGSALVTNYTAFEADPAGWAQRIQVPAGREVLLLGYVRTKGLKGAASLRLECWGRGDGREGGDPVRLASATSQEVGAGSAEPWTQVSARLRVPEGTQYVDAACLLQGHGSVWFDEVQLLPVVE